MHGAEGCWRRTRQHPFFVTDIKVFWGCEKNADLLGLTGGYGVSPVFYRLKETPIKLPHSP